MITRLNHPKMQAAIAELQDMILRSFPKVQFRVYAGEDPRAVYIDALTPEEHTLEIEDLISERESEMHFDEGLEVYVIPIYSPTQIAGDDTPKPTRRAHP